MVKYKSENTTPEQIYKLMRSGDVGKVSDNIGYIGKPADYVIYTQEDRNGAEVTICAIRFEDGKMMATNSGVFRTEIELMIDTFGKIPEIRIADGTSKNGRHFVTAELMIDTFGKIPEVQIAAERT